MKNMIAKIKDDGMFLDLMDNSKLAILPIEAPIVRCWLPKQQVEISESIQGRAFSCKIENVDTAQSVFALKMR
jgi:hypothetical protein